jgi:hypothetical protein
MRSLLIGLAVATLMLVLAGCGPADPSSPAQPEAPAPAPAPAPEPEKPAPAPAPEPETGTIQVRATDAPAKGVTKILVSVSGIEVHQADADDFTWQTLVGESNTFDLVEIEGAEVLLGTEEIQAGTYTQIRLDVDKVLVTLDGEEVEARLPGGKLKVVRSWEVKPDDVTVLTLDFDAGSFVIVTGQGDVQVKPVIKLEVTHGERPLKERPEPAPTPEPEPPKEPPKEPMTVPHTLNDRGACSDCHAEGGIKPLLADHEGRADDSCTGCHLPGVEETAPIVAAAKIGHTLDGRDLCLNCHAEDRIKPAPEDHLDRAADTCIGCHEVGDEAIAATQTARRVAHLLSGRDNCLGCHDVNKRHPFPEDHFERLNESCLICHRHL